MGGSLGYKSYLIGGLQTTDWDTPCLYSASHKKVYEFVSCGIKNNSDLILPERFKGQPSPTPGIENFYDVAGDLAMHLHADDMIFWWKQVLYNNPTSSTDFTPQIVRTSGAYGATNSLTTQPSATSPVSSPGKLIVTFSGNQTGTVTITGRDQNEVAISEVLTFANVAAQTTTKYFHSVDADGVAIAGCTGGTAAITCDKNTYIHTFALGDDVPKGSTLEIVKGGIPSTYVGCLVNTAVIDLADVMTFTLGMMGKIGYNGAIMPTSGLIPTETETPTALAAFTRVSEQVFPSWGISVEINKGSAYAEIPVSSMSLSLDNALKFPDRFRNLRTRPQPVRGGNRNYGMRIGIDYSTTENDWDPFFLSTKEVAAKVTCYRLPYAGAEYKMVITMPRCQITSFPDPAVSDYSEIIQDINLRPIRTVGASTSDEMTVVITCVAAT